ncbi:hypothetical protein [Nannocystis sp.]|uniref:hypothetical protein n=1 Tax=Nannocystis sp. TaxID=1962667 RepID=UPI0025D2DED0|nr:hypothetical protein [Nannocystis sp.]MBK7829040.1 hypothetical protein [Nannocystis sp.]
MSVFDDPKGWAKAQAQRLRDDPKGWARERGEQLRGMVDVAPFSDEALERELVALRGRIEGLAGLDAAARQQLHDDLIDLHNRLSPGGAAVSGAKIGLAAAVLPVIGMITGPLLGGAYGVYRSQRVTAARDEVQAMLRRLARG